MALLEDPLLDVLVCPIDKRGLLYFADDAMLYNPRLRLVVPDRERHTGHAAQAGRTGARRRARAADEMRPARRGHQDHGRRGRRPGGSARQLVHGQPGLAHQEDRAGQPGSRVVRVVQYESHPGRVQIAVSGPLARMALSNRRARGSSACQLDVGRPGSRRSRSRAETAAGTTDRARPPRGSRTASGRSPTAAAARRRGPGWRRSCARRPAIPPGTRPAGAARRHPRPGRAAAAPAPAAARTPRATPAGPGLCAERARFHRPGHHHAEPGGLGQGERRHELLAVAQHGGPRKCADHRPEQIPAHRGHADTGDQQSGGRGDTRPGPVVLAGADQVPGEGDDYQDQPQRRPRPAVGLRDRLRVPFAA